MTAKIVTGADKYDSSTSALKTLHWLSINLRIEYKVLTLVFRCIHKLAPNYLNDLISVKLKLNRSGLRSETNVNKLHLPRTTCKTFADRALSVHGPKLWNALPEDL